MILLKTLISILPWSLRRRALNKWFGYQIHPGAHIGYSWVFPKELKMDEGARIGHLNVAIHLDQINMGSKSTIGRGNWITGFPTKSSSRHFQHQDDRFAELTLGEASAITKNHHFDCTHSITIGRFSTIAGYNSQFLTHSIDVFENRQDSKPIVIGEYTFVGTNVTILGGSTLPSFSVLAAKSLLNKSHTEAWTTYGGVPAKSIQAIPKDAKYFSRRDGFVY